MNVNMPDLMNSLRVMGQGMAGIFIVLITIALIVTLLARLTSQNKDQKDTE